MTADTAPLPPEARELLAVTLRPKLLKSINTRMVRRRSWSHWFHEHVRHGRYIRFYADQPHVQHSWARAFKMKFDERLAPLSPVNSHAPWLNAEAIAYRGNMLNPLIENGYYLD